jgi:hypothetical protein
MIVADPDPVIFFTPGSGMGKIRIWDKHPAHIRITYEA